VTDTVWRPLADALVEIVNGPLAGTRNVTDNDGRFEFTGMSPTNSTVTLRASRDGFQTTSGAATWQADGDRPIVAVRLYSLEPPLALDAGEYGLNLTIDLSTARGRPPQLPWETEVPCQGLPVELASRSYDATITERPLGERGVSIKGPTVQRFFDGFQLFVAGDHVAFEIEWSLAEEFPGFRYLYIGGGALPEQFTVDGESVRIPFGGEFSYCELNASRGIYNDCSQVPGDRLVRRHSCISDRVLMTFTKR
jgi:hypothetical protein